MKLSVAELRAALAEDTGAATPHAQNEPLAPLRALPEHADLATVEKGLRDFAFRARGRDRLSVALLREAAMRELERVGVSGPARLVDAALAGVFEGGETVSEAGQGRAVFLTDPEPWPAPVDGAALLDELERTLERFVVLPEGASTALALAVVHTHAHEASDVCPRIGITSPTKRCGKSTLLAVLSHLVRRPLPTANLSAAALFRTVEEYGPTLLIDEADRFLGEKEELIGLLNAGYHRPFAYVLRAVGEDSEVRAFRVWTPAIIALIGDLPDTLADRAISIPLRRKTRGEKVERFRLDRLGELAILQRKAWRWAQDNLDALRAADPHVPEELNDRAQDTWRPLLAIADLAGGEWPAKARKAALQLSGPTAEDDQDVAVILLGDVRSIFVTRGASHIATAELLEALWAMEDRPWGDWKAGRPISPQALAKLLKRFNVCPRRTRNWRGYFAADFTDGWNRCLELSPASPRSNDAVSSESFNRHAPPAYDGYSGPAKSGSNGLVTDVTATSAHDEPEEVF